MFNKSLEKLDYQFIGFFAVLGLLYISIMSKTDIITGALGTLLIMMGRHLYRNSLDKTENKG